MIESLNLANLDNPANDLNLESFFLMKTDPRTNLMKLIHSLNLSWLKIRLPDQITLGHF